MSNTDILREIKDIISDECKKTTYDFNHKDDVIKTDPIQIVTIDIYAGGKNNHEHEKLRKAP